MGDTQSQLLLVQMAGQPGVGKSALAHELGGGLGAVVLDNDVIKSALLTEGIEEEVAGPATWRLVFELAESALSFGVSVILDNPSHYESIPARGAAIAERVGARYVMVECVCDDEVELRRRIVERTRLPSHITVTETEDRVWEIFGPADRVRVDMLGDPFSIAREVIERIV